MTTRKDIRAQNGVRQPFAEREVLIAYLQYAVEDVAAMSESGATLLREAIARLEVSETHRPALNGEKKHS
jgi:hypothetical protein